VEEGIDEEGGFELANSEEDEGASAEGGASTEEVAPALLSEGKLRWEKRRVRGIVLSHREKH